jgi:PIN domain nuclease of toxin-antitoxin system
MGELRLTSLMADRNVLDTHALVWFLVGSPKLGANARAILEDPDASLCLPLIALAEACWMVEKGRTPTIPSVSALLAAVDADQRVALVPLDRAILDLSLTLTAVPELHDRLIVATALYQAENGISVALLTRDASITACSPVAIVW